MTHPPPPDPLGPPSSPFPDPVLQPPAPLPGEEPRQSTDPTSSRDSDAQPAKPTRAPYRPPGPTRTSTGPARTSTGPARTSTWSPVPATARRSNGPRWSGPTVAIIAFLALCGGIVGAGFALGRVVSDGEQVTSDAPPVARRPTVTGHPAVSRSPAVSFSAPVTVVEGGQTTSFGLPVGTGVRFSDQDGSWTVALLGVEWADDCGDALGSDALGSDALGSAAPAVVFDIRYEVIGGAVSVIPLTDFAFVLTNGATARVRLLSSCAEPPLDYAIIFTGEVRRGRIVVELPAGADGAGGELTYGQRGAPTASWAIPRRAG